MFTTATIRTPERKFFQCRIDTTLALEPGEECIVNFDYGQDTATLLERAESNGATTEKLPGFKVARKLVKGDSQRLQECAELSERAKHNFSLSTEREKGEVKLLHVRISFGGERLFIRYAADFPVDLRRFIGQVQRDFKTQVDLWQLNSRDQTAMMGCLGSCGRAACCCSWQHNFPSVNVRMAKDQAVAFSQELLQGTCGHIKCCLCFEHQQYLAASAGMPDLGIEVKCRHHDNSRGMIIARDILRQRVTVRTKEGRFLTVNATEVIIIERERYYRKRPEKT